jgi:hypothetical protein
LFITREERAAYGLKFRLSATLGQDPEIELMLT